MLLSRNLCRQAVLMTPALENMQRPWPRPGRTSFKEVRPHPLDSARVEHGAQRTFGCRMDALLDFLSQLVLQPVLKGQRKPALSAVNNLVRKFTANGSHEQRLRRASDELSASRNRKEPCGQRLIDQRNSYLEAVGHTHHI